MKPTLSALAAALVSAAVCHLPAAGAELGMKAPALDLAAWVKGKAVDLSERKGRGIVVVEFWATWCGPCRESIPHLTELQRRHQDKGVTVVGITDEERAVVDRFVKLQGIQLDYAVALDRAGKTSDAYLKAFEIHGIPHAFVINRDGVIAWEGHPLEGLDEAVEAIVGGKYDLAAAGRDWRADRVMHEYFELVHHDVPDPKKVKAGGEQVLKALATHPDKLNEFAWILLTDEHVEHRDKPLALRAAEQANRVSGGTSPGILDTLAKAYFENGNREQAVATQEKALKLSADPEQKERFAARLEVYRGKR